MRRRYWIPMGLGLLAAISLLLEYGFHLDDRTRELLEVTDVVIAALFGLELLVDLSLSRGKAIRRRWYEVVLLFLFLLALPALSYLAPVEIAPDEVSGVTVRSMARVYLVGVQVFLLLSLFLQFVRGQEGLLDSDIRPEHVFVGGFALLVVVGTGLLLLPGASANASAPIRPLEAFFTATSAVCVTGLVVRDTGGDFTTFGQLVIAVLFQIGGLGIITFVALQSFSSRRGFSVPRMVALRDIVNAPNLGAVRRQVLVIAVTAVVIETVGAIVLYLRHPDGDVDFFERAHWSVFHSISAFCNAGFGLSSDSFVGLRMDLATNLCLMLLIVVGGLGAPVVGELTTRAWAAIRRPDPPIVARTWSVQTQLALWMTGGLVVIGALAFVALEWNGVLRGTSGTERVLVSLFQSVTTRTAGFNTCDTGSLTEPTLIMLCLLMVIGASPVSTGGGVKTIAIGVLFLTLRSMLARGGRVELFGRSIPDRIVRASISIFLLYFASVVVVYLVLSITDSGLPPVARLFETISALSTVGLSTGITAEFSVAGKLALCVAMFVGRIGPLTLTMTVFRGRPASRYDLPEEAMVVG